MLNNTYMLSIIIPVYNVEDYIEECLNSVLSQNMRDCELILVDDGSQDKSGDICDYYATKCEFISVFHKKNGGLSSARNFGMLKAIGEYIAFLDSDDRLAEGAIDRIIKWCKNGTDLCFMKAIKFFEGGKTLPLGDGIDKNRIYHKRKDEVIKYLSTRPKYPGSSCTKIYRRAFLQQNKIEFPKDRRTNEDLGFVLDCILKANTYDVLDFPYYEYRQGRAGSLTKSNTLKGFKDHGVFVVESIEKLMENGHPKDSNSKALMSFVAYEYAMMIYMYDRLSIQEKYSSKKWLKEYVWVLKYGHGIRLIITRLLYIIFGVSIESKIFNIVKRRK